VEKTSELRPNDLMNKILRIISVFTRVSDDARFVTAEVYCLFHGLHDSAR